MNKTDPRIEESLKELKDDFIASDEEQTHDAYPYRIPSATHKELFNRVQQELEACIESARKEAINKCLDIVVTHGHEFSKSVKELAELAKPKGDLQNE